MTKSNFGLIMISGTARILAILRGLVPAWETGLLNLILQL